MTTAPWSGPRALRGLRDRSLPTTPALQPREWGRTVGTAAGAGVRTARGYVTTCSRTAFAVLCALVVLAAMVASLFFNTARGEGAFRLAEAETSQRQAAETRLSLEAQVDEMSSPEQVSSRAEDLGMVPAGTMGYVDPRADAVIGEAEEAPAASEKKGSGSSGKEKADDERPAKEKGAAKDDDKGSKDKASKKDAEDSPARD
ncbi:cell division protein FtsL [Kytococcus sp. Marseille-QA3725]